MYRGPYPVRRGEERSRVAASSIISKESVRKGTHRLAAAQRKRGFRETVPQPSLDSDLK